MGICDRSVREYGLWIVDDAPLASWAAAIKLTRNAGFPCAPRREQSMTSMPLDASRRVKAECASRFRPCTRKTHWAKSVAQLMHRYVTVLVGPV